MVSYTFTWDHPANEVYVTGTFDNWAKTEKLEKTSRGFSKTVSLPSTNEKILYKFVVDGNWTTDHTATSQRDSAGNVNNVLQPEHLLSSAAPSSSTAAMAGQVPLEKDRSTESRSSFSKAPAETSSHSSLPGAFPETPAFESQNPHDSVKSSARDSEQTFGVAPIPATSGASNPVKLAPGEQVPHSSTYTGNTLDNNVRLDKESYEKGDAGDQTFGVAPIPATSGAGNPVTLAPGEKVPEPSTYTGNTVNNNVRLDRESYERSDAGVPHLPPVLNQQEEREAQGASIFGVPSLGGTTMIPESSLPMGDSNRAVDEAPSAYTSSAAPNSTTAQLAGQQPLEPRGVPQVVSESQHEAHFAPEASGSPAAVELKSELENEIQAKVPEAPVTSESGPFGKSERSSNATGAIAGGVAAAGAAVAGTAYLARDKAADAGLIGKSQTSSENPGPAPSELAPASASPAAVEQKGDLEKEIQEKVPTVPATSESGPFGKSERSSNATGAIAGGVAAAGAAVAGTAYLARDKAADAGLISKAQTGSNIGGSAPSDLAPASASPAAVEQKSDLEKEIQQKVPTVPATSESGLLGKSEKSSGITGLAAGGVASAVSYLPASVQNAIQNMNSSSQPASTSLASPSTTGASTTQPSGVPEIVTESQREAHVAPEASADAEAVREKSAVEKELQKHVSPTNESGEPAPTESAALSSAAPVNPTTESMRSPGTQGLGSTGGVLAGSSASGPNSPLNASSATPAQTSATKSAAQSEIAPQVPAKDSRDVSPMTRPTATTGTDNYSSPARSEGAPAPNVPTGDASAAVTTPKKSRPESSMYKDTPESSRTSGTNTSSVVGASPADGKKNKRKSFFGKLKEKLNR